MGCINGLFIGLRTFQGIFSLAALGCGVYIAWTFQSLANDADKVGEWVANYFDSGNSTETQHVEDVINEFVGPPKRAYFLICVSVWSLCAILYLLIAQYSRKHPGLNKRSIVIPLEVFTVLIWLAGFVAIASLAAESEPICFAFQYLDKVGKIKDLLDNVPVLGDILKTCSIDKLAAVAAAVCWALWCVTSIAVCCISKDGRCCRRRGKKKSTHPEVGAYETLMPMRPVGSPPAKGFMVSPQSQTNDPRKPGFTLNGSLGATAPLAHRQPDGCDQPQPSYFSPEHQAMLPSTPPLDSPKRKPIPQSPPSPAQHWPTTPASLYQTPPSNTCSPVTHYSSPQANYIVSPTDYWNR